MELFEVSEYRLCDTSESFLRNDTKSAKAKFPGESDVLPPEGSRALIDLPRALARVLGAE